MEEHRLSVSGATLFYRVQGAGELLLFIQGGDGDANGCEALVRDLANTYSVVTFDPRGLSRSALESVPVALRIQTHAEDAHHLLAALTEKPALVFGTSRGALVGLDLVVRYSSQVRGLVAHEPPLNQLLSDEERAAGRAVMEKVKIALANGGAAAAMQEFFAWLQLDFNDHEEGYVLPAPATDRAASFSFFLGNDAPAIETYRLDLAGLKKASARVVAAVGANSGNCFPGLCVAPLAKELGEPLMTFPGGHNGPSTHPRAFASRLREVLAAVESQTAIG